MTEPTQPESLRCAEWLEHIAAGKDVVEINHLASTSAKELRNQHAEIERLSPYGKALYEAHQGEISLREELDTAKADALRLRGQVIGLIEQANLLKTTVTWHETRYANLKIEYDDLFDDHVKVEAELAKFAGVEPVAWIDKDGYTAQYGKYVEQTPERGWKPLYTHPQASPQQSAASDCSNTLRMMGAAYPRTCKACGFGPCKNPVTAQGAAK